MAKLFLESEFQRNAINKRKNTHSQENLVVFSAATDSEIIIIQILHGKGHIKKLDRIVIFRTGTYLKRPTNTEAIRRREKLGLGFQPAALDKWSFILCVSTIVLPILSELRIKNIFDYGIFILFLCKSTLSQWAFGAKMTSYKHRCDVITSHQR